MGRKDFMANKIMSKLRPNAYNTNSAVWLEVKKGLVKLTNKELSGLYAILLAKRED